MSTHMRRRRTPIIAAAAALCLTSAVLGAPAAYADDGPYDIGGNPTVIPDASVAAKEPASFLPDPSGNASELGPRNGSSTKIGVIHNDPLPTLGYTKQNPQVDLMGAWLDVAQEGLDDWLYFAWERESNTGSGFIAFEFMQAKPPAACNYDPQTPAEQQALEDDCNPWANRQGDPDYVAPDDDGPEIGDFMILWDQQGNSTDLYLRKWVGTAPNITLTDPLPLNSSVSAAAYGNDGYRGEAAVNLTETIFGGESRCLSFANVIPSTVTGNSDTADYKDTILGDAPPIANCTSTTVTTPQTADDDADITAAISIGDGVVAVQDEAYITLQGGTSAAGGDVSFYLCKVAATSDLCATGGTKIGADKTLSGSFPATVVSDTAYVTSAGNYCWRAEYAGSSALGIGGSSDYADTECFVVEPVEPTLTTTASEDVLVGETISDTASLSGAATQPTTDIIEQSDTNGPDPGGKITFTLYDDTCTAVEGFEALEVDVDSGNGDYDSPDYTTTAAGTFHWVAQYTPADGDPNNVATDHNTGCDDDGETVVVSTVATSLSTEQSWVPNDSATVSSPDGGDLDGTVTFTLYPSTDCTGDAVFSEDVDVSATAEADGTAEATVSTTNEDAVAAGDYSWLVTYASDNAAQRGIADDPAGYACQETSSLSVDDGQEIQSQSE